MLSNNGLCLYAAAVHVTIFSTGSKFRPVSNLTKFHTLTRATRLYVLLCSTDEQFGMFSAVWLQCVQVSRPKALLVPGENCELPGEKTR